MKEPRLIKLTAIFSVIGLAITLLLLVIEHASAESPPVHSLEVIGHVGGVIKAIDVQEPYAYAAVGPRLAVLDLTDVSQPKLRGQTDILWVDIHQLKIQGDHVYAIDTQGGLHIFDVTNPAQPGLVATLTITGAATLAITGTHLFIATPTHLQIVDVAQPATPQVVGIYAAGVQDMAFAGNLLYLALGDRLHILDISDSGNLELITEYEVSIAEVEVEDNLVYVGQQASVAGPFGGPIYFGVLRILDVSDLADIREIFFSGDTYPGSIPSQLRGMVLSEQKLYGYGVFCGRHICELQFSGLDVSNPANPNLDHVVLYQTSRRDIYSKSHHFVIVGKRAYIAVFEALYVIDVNTQTELGRYESWIVDNAIVANNVAHIAGRSSGFLTVDVSTPHSPTVLGAYTTTVEGGGSQSASISEITIYGPYLYARVSPTGAGVSRLDILDVSNRHTPHRMETDSLFLFPEQIHHGYGYYFHAEIGVQLRSIDLSIPTQPQPAGAIVTTSSYPRLAFSGSYAYIADVYEGLHIIDISNPQAPLHINRIGNPIPGYLIDSTGGALYIFTDDALKIYDLAVPVNPIETSSTPIDGLEDTPLSGLAYLRVMKVVDNHIYLMQRNGDTSSIRVFHTPNIHSQVTQVLSQTLPSPITSFDVVGDTIYAGSSEDGLYILRHTIEWPELTKQLYLPAVAHQSTPLPTDCAIAYHSHLQEQGWQGWRSDGNESGAADGGLRIEALQVRLCDNATLPAQMSIVYQTHVQEIGWMDWAYEGQIAGTTGQHKRIEAVRFKLLNAPEGYHVTYRVYVEGSGWSNPVSDSQIAGTTGQSKRIEAVQIVLSRGPGVDHFQE